MSTSGAAPRLRLVGEGKACSCPNVKELLGDIHCHRCRGRLLLVHPGEMLAREAEREALRHLVACLLVEERESLRSPEGPAYTHRMMDLADALQTARDVCAAMPRGAR